MMIDGTFVTSDDLSHAILGVNILLELVGYCEIYQKPVVVS